MVGGNYRKRSCHLSKWCTNSAQLGLETLLEIARVLEVDVKELINSSKDDVMYIQVTK